MWKSLADCFKFCGRGKLVKNFSPLNNSLSIFYPGDLGVFYVRG